MASDTDRALKGVFASPVCAAEEVLIDVFENVEFDPPRLGRVSRGAPATSTRKES